MTVPTTTVKHADGGRISRSVRIGLNSPLATIDTRTEAERLADKLTDALKAQGWTLHAAAGETPQLLIEEYLALRDRIKQNGQQMPIILTDEKRLVDGRHRLMACYDLGLDPVTVTVSEANAREAAFDSELRRHQSRSQMAAFTTLFFEDKLRELYGHHTTGDGQLFVSQTSGVGLAMAKQAVALLNAGRIDLLVDVRNGVISSMDKAYQQHLDEQRGGENKRDVALIALSERLGKVGAAIQKLKTEVEELKSLTYAVESSEALEELIAAAVKFGSLYAGSAHEISSTLVPAGYEGSDRERRVEWMRKHTDLSPAEWVKAYKQEFGNE